MVWCSSCAKNCDRPTTYEGFLCCNICGKVLDQDQFADEPTFVKNAAGQSQRQGNYVRTIQSDYSLSRERILKNAYDDMNDMAYGLEMDDGESVIRPAVAFYTIALDRNFTRGRRRELVQASCLYIACRENKKPFLLIDFSEYLRINVYVLGGTFLQLCKLLCLHEHPIVQKPVDPSLFIHRFANRLVGEDYMVVSKTALRIIASMKRDWMQTGRKPSGLCGAALYISALSHGVKCSKSDIAHVVHVCEATLTKRLIEFENTDSASLTIEEFEKKAKELDGENNKSKEANMVSKGSGSSELLCEHKGSGEDAYAHGLCKSCYHEFIELSGGLDGGSEPPAFQRAEKERIAKECTEKSGNGSRLITDPCQELESNEQNVDEVGGSTAKKFTGPSKDGVCADHVDEVNFDKVYGVDGINDKGSDESDNFSDIDDGEVDSYLHNEEEKRYKKIIWEEMNREYVEEQAAKEAAAAAAKKAFEARFSNNPEEMQAAQELAAAAAAAVAKSKKEKQQKRAEEAKNAIPAKTAAEAARQMLTRKRLSSKINYDVLDKLFEDPVVSNTAKKSRDDLSSDVNRKNKSEPAFGDGDLEPEDEYDVGKHGEKAYDENSYHENEEVEYNYDDYYGYDAL